MTTLRYSAELLDDILFRAGEPTDGTSDFQDEALRCLNRAYRAVWMGGGEFVKGMNEPWLWLKKDTPGVLTLNPKIETGTISVTNNSTSATFSSGPAVSVANRFLKIDGHSDVFRIASHTAGATAATLDGVYTGDTASAATYEVLQLEYSLAADVLRLIAPMRAYADNVGRIEGIDLSALDRDYPLHMVDSGCPDKFAMVTESKIRFNKSGGTTSTDLIRVEYDYLRKPDDLTDDAAEEPAVPLEHRQILADIGLFYLLTTKSDARAEAIGVQARGGLQAMQADNKAKLSMIGGSSYGGLYPRAGRTRQASRPWRTESGFIIG